MSEGVQRYLQCNVALTRLADFIPSPNSRHPLTLSLFLRDITVPLLWYYATAVLVLTPNTQTLRKCVLPLSLWTFFNGATRIDLVRGHNNSERLVFWNHGLAVRSFAFFRRLPWFDTSQIVYTVLGLRVITWTFQTKPYARVKTLNEVTPQFYAATPPAIRFKQLFTDAFDLTCNLRGTGWNWSQYLQVPKETRPTSSASAFVAASFFSLILHLVIFDALHYSIQWLEPTTIGSAEGGSIFDATLPPLLRYSRSTIITFFGGMSVYSVIQAGYQLPTIIGVLVFRQDPSLWPPAFRSPWLATSLTDLWAKRWHQLFRDVFINVGGKPLFFFLGRVGGILGVFIVSGILHHFGLWGMGRGTDFLKVAGFFFMNGLGICLEHLWRYITGHRVSGWYGWAWTMVWAIGWGHMLVEAWAMRGLAGSAFLPQDMRLTTHIFGPLQW